MRNTSALAFSPHGDAERSVERRREHRDAREGHDRHPPAHSERQRGHRGKRGAVRAESAEHDLELGRDQQRGGQAEVSDDEECHRPPALPCAARMR